MYRVSIKTIKSNRWQQLETFGSFGNTKYAASDIIYSMQHNGVTAYKVEWFEDKEVKA